MANPRAWRITKWRTHARHHFSIIAIQACVRVIICMVRCRVVFVVHRLQFLVLIAFVFIFTPYFFLNHRSELGGNYWRWCFWLKREILRDLIRNVIIYYTSILVLLMNPLVLIVMFWFHHLVACSSIYNRGKSYNYQDQM